MLISDDEVAEWETDQILVGKLFVIDRVVREGAAVSKGGVERVHQQLSAMKVFLLKVGARDWVQLQTNACRIKWTRWQNANTWIKQIKTFIRYYNKFKEHQVKIHLNDELIEYWII